MLSMPMSPSAAGECDLARYAVNVLDPLVYAYDGNAHHRAVIALVDEILQHVENPRMCYATHGDPAWRDAAIAAAELRKALEKTRELWDATAQEHDE